eukprot:1997510-Rhodomonas_salina.1
MQESTLLLLAGEVEFLGQGCTPAWKVQYDPSGQGVQCPSVGELYSPCSQLRGLHSPASR